METTVQAISRATVILSSIIEGFHSIKEISGQCKLSMATVHRILKTLEESEFVFQNTMDSKYYLGPVLNQSLLHHSSTHQYLIAQSSDEVNRLWDLFNEFTALDIQVELSQVSLLVKHSKFDYGVIRAPNTLFYGSQAIVLLSQLNDREIEVILNNINLKAVFENGNEDKDKFRKQIYQAKRQGYYISEELNEGIIGISVPVVGYLCPVVLSIVGPKKRTYSVSLRIVEEMKKAANHIVGNISQNRTH